jgi:tRNA 2-selenouridine synthase
VTQKTFERRVVERARAGFGTYVVFEGESRKVGDVIVPPTLWRAMSDATHVELVAPLERRVAVLRDDYLAHPGSVQALEEPLAFLDARLGLVEGAPCLRELLARGEIERLVSLVLERYYDPRYRHGEQGRAIAARFDASDPVRCAREVAAWIEARGAHGADRARRAS